LAEHEQGNGVNRKGIQSWPSVFDANASESNVFCSPCPLQAVEYSRNNLTLTLQRQAASRGANAILALSFDIEPLGHGRRSVVTVSCGTLMQTFFFFDRSDRDENSYPLSALGLRDRLPGAY
jgi:hypothetical protein